MADCLNNEQQINSNLSESNVDALTSSLDGASSVTSEMSGESSVSSTMSSTDATTSNLGSEEPLNSELDLPTTYTYRGSETDNIVVTVDNRGFIISASVKQIKFNSVSDFPEVGSEHLIYIDATNKALYGWDANSGYYKLVADVEVPTKLSEFENDGDGINPFITKVVSDLQNYYTKSETYTQDEINNLVSAIPKFSIKVVTELPTTDISETTVYLVASGSGQQNLYVEYIYINDTWEKLGEQTIDLSNYPTIEEMNTAIVDNLANYYTSEQVDDLLSTLRSEIPSKTSDLTNDGNGISPFATVAHLALRKIVYTGISGSEYSMNDTAVVNLDSFTYSTFDSIPNGTMIEVTFQNPYVNAINDFPLFLNVNETGAYRVLVTDGKTDSYYNAVTMGGWKANDVLTFVKGRSWMLIAISGRLVIGNTDLNAIKSQYLKDAIITDNTLRITKQDGSTIEFQGGGISDEELPFMPIGSIFASAIPQKDARVHLLDGSTILQTGIYADFANLINSLKNDGYDIAYETNDEFDADVTATGNCGKFVIDNDAGTIRLPKITTFIQGLSDLTNLTDIGSKVEAGLPNIKASYSALLRDDGVTESVTGAFSVSTPRSRSWSGSTGDGIRALSFNANTYNSIYKDNVNTVQPPATRYPYYIVLASGYKSTQQVNVDNIMNEVDGKLSKSEIKRYAIDTYSDGNTKYTIYNDGFKTCSGIMWTNQSVSSSNELNITLALPVEFSGNYTVVYNGSNYVIPLGSWNHSTQSCLLRFGGYQGSRTLSRVDWYAEGY